MVVGELFTVYFRSVLHGNYFDGPLPLEELWRPPKSTIYVKLYNSEASHPLSPSVDFGPDVYLCALEVIKDHIGPRLQENSELLRTCKRAISLLNAYMAFEDKERSNRYYMVHPDDQKQINMWQSPALRKYFPAICLQIIVQTYLRGCAEYDKGISNFPDTRKLKLRRMFCDDFEWVFLDVARYFDSESSPLPFDTYTPDFSPKRLIAELDCIVNAGVVRFNEIHLRHQALYCAPLLHSPSFTNNYSFDTIPNMLLCLDIAESVSKLIPRFGNVVEGICGVLRKILTAAEGARETHSQWRMLAQYTSSITLAIINEISPRAIADILASLPSLMDFAKTVEVIQISITQYSKQGRIRTFFSRNTIDAKVRELRTRLDNARVIFQIRADISTVQILHDLHSLQTRIYEQQTRIYEQQCLMSRQLEQVLRCLSLREPGQEESGQGRIEEIDVSG